MSGEDEPGRRVVSCPHAPACPGCEGIGVPLAAQLAGKRARVAAAAGRYPVLAGLEVEAVRPAPTATGYRVRAKLVVAPGGRVGLYARASHEVLDLPGCRVLAPVVAEAAAALRRLLAAPPAAAGDALRAEGDGAGRLRAVDLRELQGPEGAGLLVTLVLRARRGAAAGAPRRAAGAGAAGGDDAEARAAARALADALPALRGVAVSLHDGRSPRLLGAPPRPILGPPLHRDAVAPGTPWTLVAAGGFAQAHRAQAAALYDAVAAGLAPLAGRRVLELYAGSGALGLALAAGGARVTAVESFAPAAEAAREAARAQGLAGAFAVRAEPAERSLAALRAGGTRFDAVVVDPPRRGLSPRVREAVAALAGEVIVYVSCAPETLARDLAHLAWLGWRAARLAPFDLMPLTAEVECLAVLARGAPPAPTVLYEDAALLAVAKPPHLPTVPHPERPGSLLERVRALPGAAEAVPVHRLDADTSGVCLFARSAAHAAAGQRALADPATAKRYLALVRGFARAHGRVARPIVEGGRARPAVTRYRRLRVVAGHALLEVAPETGRTHQIRRHLAAIGEPVLGDARHGHAASNRHLFERAGLDRPFLHCAVLELVRPGGGAPLRLEAPLAPDLRAVLMRLGEARPDGGPDPA